MCFRKPCASDPCAEVDGSWLSFPARGQDPAAAAPQAGVQQFQELDPVVEEQTAELRRKKSQATAEGHTVQLFQGLTVGLEETEQT